MKLTWNNCFSNKRFGFQSDIPDIRNEYERDWDRIIFSSPFRRLQNKTQVFPLPEEIFVHNRLTHSLEVASVGRSLGKIVGKRLLEIEEISKEENARKFYKNNLKNVIGAACLAHDLGNPAFGHSGEEAISKYFKKRDTNKVEDQEFKNQFTNNEWKDLTTFEGNANALRIITHSQKNRLEGGFRLTYSTLGAILKYPCESLASEGGSGQKHKKKYGYFKADEEIFIQICKELNMVDESSNNLISYKRHPFVYLVEAADDICYNIIDFEDAHRLGILSFNCVKDIFLQIISLNTNEDKTKIEETIKKLEKDTNECIAYLRAKCINTLIYKCADTFFQKEALIIKGEYNNSLIEDIPELNEIFEKISSINYKLIYNNKKVVELELAGFKIMSALVEDFVTAALSQENNRDKEQKKILELLPEQFGFEEGQTPYYKVMCILDYISGMTDLYALKLYRKLKGIEI
ncbi:deoxyguanosinetriphosphate triphosphohydrolase [Elizabethkingia miricola]|uniref:deoxyguanosinetriphosphate triphosphohydrolase n=3 Tax=Elizabethkingia miricola TaxID=172045 RepID=UPI000C14D0E3|nr:deoxyguanosinetriphosphate triphosphohydrolase [Elizabethkingia miricola]NHQ72740.1 deoxyguanosinetriphosphate triphosphohydrolase [Elizabethkingia miricola]PSL89904.1 deoxyguanosinetriphosphate triphosphohydrolase [Elizabethkingia miricola]QHQ88505.1 deoxyguanosinetriphosphate triphosphohydrolase [Elizabethkingia miricola]UIO96053.1 deoxyguanosinetriphosphate triphosphohydrolase [Elizabethkingia miricola]WER12838.1 deoxyguanosinetriphosphate triphosphohydrolase [Elizabethkingia miricola]